MKNITEVSVIHAIPGRLRLKIASLKNNPTLAQELETRLAVLAGMQEVLANTVTGSLLVVFAEKSADWATLANTLAKPLAALFPPVKPKDLSGALAAGVAACRAGRPASEGIAESFSRLNSMITGATGGVFDLRVLLPLGLFYLGLRSLWTSEKLTLPAWYDYFWFALSTFIMLNRWLVDQRK